MHFTLGDIPIDAECLQFSAYQQVPAGIAYAAASPYIGSTPGQVMGEFVGPDERVYEEIAQPFSQAVQAPGQLEGNGAQQTAGQTAGAMGDIIPTGLLGSALRAVQGVVGSPLGTAPGLVSGVGNAGQIIGYLANGLPAPLQPSNRFPSQHRARFSLRTRLTNSTKQSLAFTRPSVGWLQGAQLRGSLVPRLALSSTPSRYAGEAPIVDKDGNAAGSTFGILSHPNDASAAAASPSATAVSSVDTRSPGNPNVDPSAESALGNDGADEENGDNDDGEDDRDSEDDGVEGKDPTDDNDDSTSNNLFHG
ncbi:hypothetical protein FRC04_006232 [Tulasnella sp. 424]|nr:hypothetical protein FRC04_006232 [Tulasnella sp. 424]